MKQALMAYASFGRKTAKTDFAVLSAATAEKDGVLSP
jgi:hypothetical protein